MHSHPGCSIGSALFTSANVVIALGYLAVPFLVLPYLPLTRTVLIYGAGFFLGCAGTHVGMAFLMEHSLSWFWVTEHVIQAVFTWGFIITFRRMLQSAQKHRRARLGGGDAG